ncbi:MAG: hypothetical protein HDR88_18135 [Bacteroides sp.]|nr:hypothetical protein [Bacteroides sp.]
MITDIRKTFWYGAMTFFLLPMMACSGENSAMQEPQQPDSDQLEEEIDYRGYYYDGKIELFKAENNEKVYSIYGPMMYPIYYGHTIPVPVPDYESRIVVKMGEGTVIDQNSVRLVINGEEVVRDMPSDGNTIVYVSNKSVSAEYRPEVSITRTSADEYEVKIAPSGHHINYDDVKVIMKPIPYWAFDDFTGDKSMFLKFESPADYNLPEEIAIHFLPHTFSDAYRPIRQYHLTVY